MTKPRPNKSGVKKPKFAKYMKEAWEDPELRAKMMAGRLTPEQEQRIESVKLGLCDCAMCGKTKPQEEFPKGKSARGRRPGYAYCKECHSNRERIRRIKKWFNLTPEDYDKILAHQGGVCFICKQPPKENRRLAVDHDHKTGLVRGLLCSFCNRAIAVFRDDFERLRNASSFLESPPATAALGGERYGLKGRVSNKASTIRRLNRDLFDRPKDA